MMAPAEPKLELAAWRRVVPAAVVVLLTYWTVYSVVTPVTVWDSHTYNLARLLLARSDGLFGNELWNTPRQVAFPWSFDAVHYPFLAWFRGWGVALPSYLCFVGILATVHQSVTEWRGPRTAWWCSLTLFALPTLMFQASSTKNDLAVVFGIACWFHAWRWWRESGARAAPWWMAAALGFAAGAKSSGVLLAVLLGVFTLWQLRASRVRLAEHAVALALAALLLGSVETYVNNRIVYGYWLGSR